MAKQKPTINQLTIPANITSGSATPSTAGDYTVATADLSNYPTGASILLIASFQWNKSSGTPASTYRIMYNSSIVNSMTTTYSYTASTYDGHTTFGVITKVAGVNSAYAQLNIDGSVTGSSASGKIFSMQIG